MRKVLISLTDGKMIYSNMWYCNNFIWKHHISKGTVDSVNNIRENQKESRIGLCCAELSALQGNFINVQFLSRLFYVII